MVVMVRLVRALVVMGRIAVGRRVGMIAGIDVQMRMTVASQIAEVVCPDAGLQSAHQQQSDQDVATETIQSTRILGRNVRPAREKSAGKSLTGKRSAGVIES